MAIMWRPQLCGAQHSDTYRSDEQQKISTNQRHIIFHFLIFFYIVKPTITTKEALLCSIKSSRIPAQLVVT